MHSTLKHDAFLSYSRKDDVIAREIVTTLDKMDVRVWMDVNELDYGALIFLEIERAIAESRCLILLMSKNSVAENTSEWVSLERCTALFRDPANKGRGFIPVLIDEVKIPDLLRGFLYADLRSDCVDRSANLERLANTIKLLANQSQTPRVQLVIGNNQDTQTKNEEKCFASLESGIPSD